MFMSLVIPVTNEMTAISRRNDHKGKKIEMCGDDTMKSQSVTRGYGALEGFLARLRAKKANELIPHPLRTGKILDIGCGSHPFFLLNTHFAQKYGIDKAARAGHMCHTTETISLLNCDIESTLQVPFPDKTFNVVTMLAVFEHIEPSLLLDIVREVRRVLVPGGIFVLTTPAVWTKRLLQLMAFIRLVSPVEIAEHKGAYTHGEILTLLERAGFPNRNTDCGFFEFYLNLWVVARR